MLKELARMRKDVCVVRIDRIPIHRESGIMGELSGVPHENQRTGAAGTALCVMNPIRVFVVEESVTGQRRVMADVIHEAFCRVRAQPARRTFTTERAGVAGKFVDELHRVTSNRILYGHSMR